MSLQPDPEFVRVQRNIRAITTAIQLIQPPSAVTQNPVPSTQSDYALSKAYNHIAILLTQGLDREGAVAVTGKVTSSGSSVSAIENVETLSPLSSSTFTQNSETKQSDPLSVALDVEKIERSGKSLRLLSDSSTKYVSASRTLPRLTRCPAPGKIFRSRYMRPTCYRPLSISPETGSIEQPMVVSS
jgi:hypothetical protein